MKMATSLLWTPFPYSTTTPAHESPMINSSTPQNGTSTSNQLPDLLLSCFTMSFGVFSNLIALGILIKSRVRIRRQSNAPFLQLTMALLLADLGGHLMLGAFALHMHINKRRSILFGTDTKLCPVFGAAMVFFGLCPLLFGFAMALERYVAITQPFFHTSTITETHAQWVVLFFSSVAFALAVIPLFGIGNYTFQSPGTWCFLQIQDQQTIADKSLVLTFSSLGLIALTLSLLCNICSGLALLQARIKSSNNTRNTKGRLARRGSSASSVSMFCSLDMEMIVQLAVITMVSCICWGPFLIHITLMQYKKSGMQDPLKDGFTLLGLRMASWNQILDPWVYILLRKTVLSRICCGYKSPRFTVSAESSCVEYRREAFSLH